METDRFHVNSVDARDLIGLTQHTRIKVVTIIDHIGIRDKGVENAGGVVSETRSRDGVRRQRILRFIALWDQSILLIRSVRGDDNIEGGDWCRSGDLLLR